ncbi:MAG: glycosyltransferase [Cyanobacteria bacterium K_DeepCast_35m_m2_023]|nr:glycosyltransferase [Cyanobacteria bacterium K_DeepCast_35m_m2_023]
MGELWGWLLLLWPLAVRRRTEADCPPWVRRSVLLILVWLLGRYLHWRLAASLNLATPLSASLSWLLLLAEAWLLVSGLVPLLLSWRRFDDGRAAADGAHAHWQAGSWRPQVAVLVPTCGEPLAVLERCLVGCTGLSYPHTTVWVLDDSGRTSVRELAERHGCHYLSRPERLHAKAGNLNAGLAASTGELVAVFDADFVPQWHFLERTIGLLADPAVGLVQTPQVFFNADPLMRNLAMERWMLPDEDNFYRWIEPVRSAWGAVVCAGTSFVTRRSALEQVGGFNEAALSEDFVTGIALLGRGWQLRYLGEPLSAGLAAETLLDFVRQRQRWAAGTLQSLRLPQGPLRQGGLGWGQRLALLEGCLHWLNHLPRLLLLVMPLAYGLLGVAPILISRQGLLGALLPLWAAMLLSIGWLNRGSRHAVLSELPSWVLTIPLATTVAASLLGRFGGFRITPKQQPRQRGGANPLLTVPLLVLLALNGLNLLNLARALARGGPDPSLQLGLVWALLTLLGLLVALRACWDSADPEPVPWLAVPLRCELASAGGSRGTTITAHAQVEAISERGMDLLLPSATEAGAAADPPSARSWQIQLLPMGADAPALPPLPGELLPGGRGHGRISVRWSAGAAQQELQRWLFCRPGCWQQRPAPCEPRALLALVRRLVSPVRSLGPGRRSLVLQAAGSGVRSIAGRATLSRQVQR